uniref:Uncharacterized protein n=1 Tax=Oryza sativa subsp. japonica TaxID=39947 RepID=Q688H4_ORYSJ|nr:hypothetical protein [Oryza sativa Japonica Group]AAV32236.1 hypothetical protein [Oryza sativa Japonica Group]
MGNTPAAAADLRFCLLEEGRPPPVAAACNPTPPWLLAIRVSRVDFLSFFFLAGFDRSLMWLLPQWFCIIAAVAMVAVFAAEIFPWCESKGDVALCAIALAGALLMGPILGLAMTACAADDDEAAARIPSRYTRSEENMGRAAIMAVALLGLYVIYLAAVRGGDSGRFLDAACYVMMGLGLIVGHSVTWIEE